MIFFRRRVKPDASHVTVSDDEVLDVTVRLLAKNPAATFADIGRRARVNDKQMLERFTSLEHLTDLAIMRGARRIARSAFLEDGTPAQQIALLVARMWDDQQPVIAFALRGVYGPLRANIAQTLAPIRDLAADALARGADDGTFRTDAPPATVAWLIQQTTVLCLEHGAREKLSPAAGRELAMRQALSTAGLSWTAAGDVVESVRASLR